MDDAKIRNFSEFSNFLMKNLIKIEKIQLNLFVSGTDR